MALDAVTEKDLLEKVGKEATEATKLAIKGAEDKLNEQVKTFEKGAMTKAEFDAFKTEILEPINEKLRILDETNTKLDEANIKQGEKISELLGKAAPNSISFEEFIVKQGPELAKMRAAGMGCIEITGDQLKAAGISSIGSSIPTPSPYAPGISGLPLEVFDIVRNPNYITSKVNIGRTNQSRLAWINEISIQGAVAQVTEGNLKPLTQHTFSVETSVAKKAAAYVGITEELDQDLPYLSTTVQRMLQTVVIRAWDDFVQADVIAAATPFNITQLNGLIQAANAWDALLAMMGQVGYYNFTPNTVAINYLTNVLLKTLKTTQNEYLLPAFANEMEDVMNYANKVVTNYGLVGDLKQYNVDIYKDFILKMGWVNDDLIRNQFSVVGEIRYHSYISSARKLALCYNSIPAVDLLITA